VFSKRKRKELVRDNGLFLEWVVRSKGVGSKGSSQGRTQKGKGGKKEVGKGFSG